MNNLEIIVFMLLFGVIGFETGWLYGRGSALKKLSRVVDELNKMWELKNE